MIVNLYVLFHFLCDFLGKDHFWKWSNDLGLDRDIPGSISRIKNVIQLYRCSWLQVVPSGISVYRCIGAAQIGHPQRRHNDISGS